MVAIPTTLAVAKDDFDRDGYVVIRNFLSNAEVRELEDRVANYIRNELAAQPTGAAFYEDKDKPETLFRLNTLHQRNPYFAGLAVRKAFISLAETLLNDTVVSKGVQMFGKAPRSGKETPAHQDAYYFNIEPNEALTIWLPLDNADKENGCIRYVPGSHKRGLLPHGRGTTFGFSMGLLDYTDEDRAAEVAINVQPGDLVAHHCLLLHRADPNPSDRRRWAMGLVYYASRARIDQAARDARDRAVHAEWQVSNKI